MKSNTFLFEAVDLTHTLSPDIPGWDGDCGFRLSRALDYADCAPPDVFRKHDMQTPTGIGTHIDAPAHCVPGGATIESLDMHNLITDCVVIKIDTHDIDTHDDEHYLIMPEAVEAFEKEHGEIAANTFVIFYTGWDKHWHTPEKYINDHKFPSVHGSTAELLLKRNIAGLGIDTLSADTGAEGFPVHRAILGAGKYLVENIARAGSLPPTGARSFALPMKIKDGAEAPIRLVALVPKT